MVDKLRPPRENYFESDDVKLFVQLPDGTTVQIAAKPLDSIDDLKDMVIAKGVSANGVQLSHAGCVLDGSSSVFENGFRPGDTIVCSHSAKKSD